MFNPKTIQLPKKSVENQDVCNNILARCRPLCRSRRRRWRGQQQPAAAERALLARPPPECLARRFEGVSPQGLCPLLAVDKRVGIKEPPRQAVLRLCTAPLDDAVDTTYMDYMQLAKDLGAWQLARPPPCEHRPCSCCVCDPRGYPLAEPEITMADVDSFEERVKQDSGGSGYRAMY